VADIRPLIAAGAGPSRPAARRRWRWLAAAVVLLAIGAGLYYQFGRTPPPPPADVVPSLTMDAVKGTTVVAVAPGSPAAKAGLQANDVLISAKEVPLFSTYDIQVALHGVGDKGKLALEVQRGGAQEKLTLDLSGDWRRWDISWRKSIEHFRPTVGLTGSALDKDAKAKLKIPADGLAFKLKSVNATSPAGRPACRPTTSSWTSAHPSGSCSTRN
jgi:membrane-associated protease RseP (regulator of RpoE activity)